MNMMVLEHYIKSHYIVNQGLQDAKKITLAVFEQFSNFAKREIL